MKTLEIRRHAPRDPTEDRLSAEGRARAEDVGRGLAGGYDVVFVSPARRAAETVAWLLRGRNEQLPAHSVVPGLAGVDAPERADLARVLRGILDEIPDGGRALAVGHTPLIERGVRALTGHEPASLAACEGVLIEQDDRGALSVRELRLDH